MQSADHSRLIRTGKAECPSVGIRVDPDYDGTGVRDAGGGAQRAGIGTGDVITAIGGVEVAGPTAFIVALALHADRGHGDLDDDGRRRQP